MASSSRLLRSELSAVLSPPPGYTVRIEENAGVRLYRAVRVLGPEWICAKGRRTYSAAETDAKLHSSGVRAVTAGGAK